MKTKNSMNISMIVSWIMISLVIFWFILFIVWPATEDIVLCKSLGYDAASSEGKYIRCCSNGINEDSTDFKQICKVFEKDIIVKKIK